VTDLPAFDWLVRCLIVRYKLKQEPWLSQGNTARCSVFFLHPMTLRLLFPLLIETSLFASGSEGRNCTGSHLLPKSRLIVKLTINKNSTMAHVFWYKVHRHPRSLILAPIYSAHGTFYWPSIVIMVLACRVSVIALYAESHLIFQ